MKATMTGSLVVLAALVSAGSVLAHHSLASFDKTKAVRVKGTVLRFHKINPHSFIYVEEKAADGQIRRWAAEGPGVLQLDRRNVADDFLKPGDEVEVCGYAHKENVIWQIATPTPNGDRRASSLSGRLLAAELLVMPGGQELNWEDYGTHLCFPPGYRDAHSK